MNFGRFCESGFWMAKVAMNRMSEGNTFYGRKLHITSYVESLVPCAGHRVSSRYECFIEEALLEEKKGRDSENEKEDTLNGTARARSVRLPAALP